MFARMSIRGGTGLKRGKGGEGGGGLFGGVFEKAIGGCMGALMANANKKEKLQSEFDVKSENKEEVEEHKEDKEEVKEVKEDQEDQEDQEDKEDDGTHARL